MNFRPPISLIIKGRILDSAKLREKRILPLYASKERTLAFLGNNVRSRYLIKWKRVIVEIEIRPQNRAPILPRYARNERGLAQMSQNCEEFYVDDTK